jgi:hypothetical protein
MVQHRFHSVGEISLLMSSIDREKLNLLNGKCKSKKNGQPGKAVVGARFGYMFSAM